MTGRDGKTLSRDATLRLMNEWMEMKMNMNESRECTQKANESMAANGTGKSIGSVWFALVQRLSAGEEGYPNPLHLPLPPSQLALIGSSSGGIIRR